MPDDTGGIVSSDELDRLADLFLRFEGAPDPASFVCKEAEQQFDSLWRRFTHRKLPQNTKASRFPNSGVTLGISAASGSPNKVHDIHASCLNLLAGVTLRNTPIYFLLTDRCPRRGLAGARREIEKQISLLQTMDRMSELMNKILAAKLQLREELAALPFDQKVDLMERMRKAHVIQAESALQQIEKDLRPMRTGKIKCGN